jgi:hypothetical protein
MGILMFIFMGLIGLVLVGALIGAWVGNSDPLTDYELYGMDAEDYLAEKMGPEEYAKYVDQ